MSASPSIIPPVTPAIVAATLNGINVVRFQFDHPVTYTGDFSSSNLTAGFGFSAPDSGSQATADTIDLHFGGAVNSGDSWDLSGPPSWAAEAIVNPAGGTIS